MIEVSAGILLRGEDVLICKRAHGGFCAHLWEFPGGKREGDESMEACLIRECQEELGIAVRVDALYDEFDWQYPDRALHFVFFTAIITAREPELRVHEEIRWVNRRDLETYPFCPPDIPVARRLTREPKN